MGAFRGLIRKLMLYWHCWRHCKYKEQVSFFWVHGEWLRVWHKQIVREPLHCSGNSFVPHSETLLNEPRKKDAHSLKLTWKVIYEWKRHPFFSCEPISKTGYWLGVCYGWFHLHRLTRAARSENRALQNEKFLPIPGLELTTPDSQV